MSANWQPKSISEVATFLNYKRIPLSSMVRSKRKGGYPYYGASGIVDYVDDYIFDGSHLLISEDGENLRSRKTPIAFKAYGKFWVNNHAHIIKENEDGILDYLEYYFSIFDLTPFITGAVQPKLNKANLDSIKIPIPPLGERRKINGLLNALSQKILVNNRTNELLEEAAQALFKSWFIDFDPIKAKMVALESGASEEDANLSAMKIISGKTAEELFVFKTHNLEAYNNLQATAALFPSAMEESEFGAIPKTWTVSSIGNEVCVVGGGTPSTKEPEFWNNGTFHWATPKDLSGINEKVLLTTERKISESGLNKISSGLLPINTVLMSSRAPVGYLAIAKVPVAINQGFIAMKCDQTLSAEFVVQWCSSNMDEIKQRASGTTFAEISKNSFRPIQVVVPSREIVAAYTSKARAIYQMISENASQSEGLRETREALLPKLISGEIVLPEYSSAGS